MPNIWTQIFKALNSISFGHKIKIQTDSILVLGLTTLPWILLICWGIHKATKKLFPAFVLENIFLVLWQFTCITQIAKIHPRLKKALSMGPLVDLKPNDIYKPLEKIALRKPEFFYDHFTVTLKQILYLGKTPLHKNCLWKTNVGLALFFLIMIAIAALCLFGMALGSIIIANFLIFSICFSNACSLHFGAFAICLLTMYSIEHQDCEEPEEMIS